MVTSCHRGPRASRFRAPRPQLRAAPPPPPSAFVADRRIVLVADAGVVAFGLLHDLPVSRLLPGRAARRARHAPHAVLRAAHPSGVPQRQHEPGPGALDQRPAHPRADAARRAVEARPARADPPLPGVRHLPLVGARAHPAAAAAALCAARRRMRQLGRPTGAKRGCWRPQVADGPLPRRRPTAIGRAVLDEGGVKLRRRCCRARRRSP